jgi:hypothetical protein
VNTENEKVVRDQKELWLVLDETGEPIHCASWASACHEHINDAINDFQIEGADKWRVIQAAALQSQVSNTTQDWKVQAIGYIDRVQLERWERLRGTEYACKEIGYIGFSREPFQTELTDCTLAVYATLPQQQEQSGEAVAYGLPNTAITGKKQALMQVRLDIPSNDQYGGALWVPLYLAPPTSTAIAAVMIRQAAGILDNGMYGYTCKAGITKESMKAEILALTPAAAEAEFVKVVLKVINEEQEYTEEGVRRVLEEAKGEVK